MKGLVENGFAVFPKFFSATECNVLKKRIDWIVANGKDEIDRCQSVFSTVKERDKPTMDRYFMDSGDKIAFFMEDDASSKSINKIGHALHDKDPVFQLFCYQKRLREMCRDIGFKDPRMVQTMWIMKGPRVGGVVSPHTDSQFLMTDPLSVHGLWVAMDDATVSNGCLWAIPGSHKQKLTHFFRALPDRSGARWDEGHNPKQWDQMLDKGVPLEAPQGTLVILHGSLVHYSAKNQSQEPRAALTMHVVEGQSTWRNDNWLSSHHGFPKWD